MNNMYPSFIDLLLEEFDSVIVNILLRDIKMKCMNESLILIENNIEVDESSWFGNAEVEYIESSRQDFIRELLLLSHNEKLLSGTFASSFPDAAFQYFYEKSFDEYDNGFDRINSSINLLKGFLEIVRGSEDDYFLILYISEVISDALARKKSDVESIYRFFGVENFRKVSLYISDVILSLAKSKVPQDIDEIYWDIYRIVLVDYISAMFEDD